MPILNLWRPKQIANDIWRASDPALAPDAGIGGRERPAPGLLSWWWVLWIVSAFVSNIAARAYLSGNETEELLTADYVDIGSRCVDIAAAALAIAIVLGLTSRQEERQRIVARAAAEAPPAGTGLPV